MDENYITLVKIAIELKNIEFLERELKSGTLSPDEVVYLFDYELTPTPPHALYSLPLLHYAFLSQCLEIMELLLAYGADVTKESSRGEFAFSFWEPTNKAVWEVYKPQLDCFNQALTKYIEQLLPQNVRKYFNKQYFEKMPLEKRMHVIKAIKAILESTKAPIDKDKQKEELLRLPLFNQAAQFLYAWRASKKPTALQQTSTALQKDAAVIVARMVSSEFR